MSVSYFILTDDFVSRPDDFSPAFAQLRDLTRLSVGSTPPVLAAWFSSSSDSSAFDASYVRDLFSALSAQLPSKLVLANLKISGNNLLDRWAGYGVDRWELYECTFRNHRTFCSAAYLLF